MRLIVVQLSDMHCGPSSDKQTQKIKKAVEAICALGSFDKAIVVLSGDIADTASAEEYSAAQITLDCFIEELSRRLNCFIPLLIVPGNHDIYLPEGSRGAKEIESWDKDEHMQDELRLQSSFFSYAKLKRCFQEDALCDNQLVDCGSGVNVQFCLLNSAPFSTLAPDDKQFHHFPSYVAEMLSRNPDADLKITVMHHHFEWCDWDTKEMLKKAISTDDITFFGHDHKPESLTTEYANGVTYNIIMGGRFDLDLNQDAAFNAIVFNNETTKISRFEFNWIKDEGIFTHKELGAIAKKKTHLTPSTEYLDELLSDPLRISKQYTDYYVLPKLAIEDGTFPNDSISNKVEFKDIFSLLQQNKVIRITGKPDAGKTALLRYLYNASIVEGFVPILIERRDYTDSRIDKMFKDLFEEQYRPLSQYDYERYLQTEDSRKIVFLDDADLISNKKAWTNLVASIIGSGKYLIFTTTETNQDLEEVVKAELQGKSTSINIHPVYKETRDALVDAVGALHGKSAGYLDDIKLSLDYIAQTQTSFFSFTPSSTLQYIKFLMSDGASEHKGVQTISMVFETNIRTSILELKNDIEANIYLAALEYIADCMYFKLRTEEISNTDLDSIINNYNENRRTAISSIDFLDTCISANIFKESSHPFHVQFFDNNTYAYFVAKSLNREFERDRMNRDKLNYVMEHICFGINDSIILFLSFIRSNTAIIIEIARKAVDLIKNYPEWDFEKRNIPFLHAAPPISDSLPSEEEKQQAHENIELIEHEKHEAIKFRGIFDFNETDVSKTSFVIMRSFKYAQLVGRALVDQYGALDSGEIDEIIQTLFSVSPRIVYAMLQPYQEHADEMVQSILEFAKENLPEMSVSEQRVRALLGQAGTTMALNIFDDISFNTANRSTIIALRDAPVTNVTRKILQLMMEENVGNTPEFVSQAVQLRKEIEHIPYAQMLVARIARKHIMYTGSIDHRQIDALLSGNVLSKKGKPSLLISKGRYNRD